MKSFATPEEKEAYYAKRRKRGVIVGGIGAVVLGGGFFLQYLLYLNNMSFDLVMYSLTTIGISLVFYAAIEIFGW
ncbi:MAG: hypothetical protein MUE30_13045 [Spirosomaceae bacterium]|nr:hypothetical protein [Spirosomataceae bacterium]